MSSIVAVDVRVYGRVQGVGFRAFVEREARARSIRGWVRNRSDGSVEIHAEGDGAEVDRFLRDVGRGPALSGVTEVRRNPGRPDGESGFEVRRSE